MPQIINTNMASLNAQRNLDKSQTANQTALQRLSSGLRINSAKDDAAGMAISTRFTSQIKGLNVVVRNAGDGIALAQTAEGALGSMNDNLQRIRELAVQSANATNSDVDREALQAEVSQLIAEITRTAEETDFNGRKLLDGSFKATFQVGANAGQTLDINIAELTSDKLGAAATAGVSALGVGEKISNGDLIINGEAIRASISKDDSLSAFDRDKSAVAKVAAINASSEKSGVTATVNENVRVGNEIGIGDDASGAVDIFINGVEISLQGTDNSDEVAISGTRNAVVAAINAKAGQTGVTAEDGGEFGGVILKAADGRNITISDAADGTGATDLTVFGLGDVAVGEETTYAGYTLNAKNSNTPIVVQGGNGTGNGDIKNSGLTAGTYTPQQASVTNKAASANATTGLHGADADARALADGDLVINGVTIGASTALDDTSSSVDNKASAIALAAAINKASAATGVKAVVNANEVVGAENEITYAAGDLAIDLNGVTINVADTGAADTNLTAAVDAINQETGRTGVRAVDNGVSITLIADDGRNIDIANASGGATFGLADVGADDTYYGTFTLTSSKAIDISYGSGSREELENTGLSAGKFGGGEDGQALTEIDISTFEGAQAALVAVDNAIGQVASQRADLGAIQNRMESTVSNLKVTSENLSAANSRIQDADFAAETAEMARTQILQQAGISVLAQANASGQNVLSLLG